MFFWRALNGSEVVRTLTGDRIYNTADDSVENEEDTRVPYCIITNNGGLNESESKDFGCEGSEDIENIGIEIAATSREELAMIAKAVRKAVKEAAADFDDSDAEELEFWLEDYSVSWGEVMFDPFKPCFWQMISYHCNTTASE